MASLAHVASSSERKVDVVAFRASPVTSSLDCSFFRLFGSLRDILLTLRFLWNQTGVRVVVALRGTLSSCGAREIGINLEVLELAILLHLDSLQLEAGRRIVVFLLRLEEVHGLATQILL